MICFPTHPVPVFIIGFVVIQTSRANDIQLLLHPLSDNRFNIIQDRSYEQEDNRFTMIQERSYE